jgi:preprotein translocase subunit Sec61beta
MESRNINPWLLVLMSIAVAWIVARIAFAATRHQTENG